MTTPDPAPLPWRVNPARECEILDADGNDVPAYAPAFAARVVRAVNHHDALVAMVERLADFVHIGDPAEATAFVAYELLRAVNR